MITIVPGHLIKINATILPKKIGLHNGTGFTVYHDNYWSILGPQNSPFPALNVEVGQRKYCIVVCFKYGLAINVTRVFDKLIITTHCIVPKCSIKQTNNFVKGTGPG